jgi:two-component system cell cycle response regulator
LDAKLVQAYLKPLNCHIINAATGEKAFLVINKIKFDLIILDVMLPDINGYEICSRLKNSPATRNIPIIFSTSLRDMESKIAGIEQDADCFLVKPLDRRELMAQAQALIKRKKQLDKITSNYENMMNLGSDHGGHLVFKN